MPHAFHFRRRPSRSRPPDGTYRSLTTEIVAVASVSPLDLAVIVMVPVCPRFALIIAMASPLKALRSFEANIVKSVASPLSVATISPGPLISK